MADRYVVVPSWMVRGHEEFTDAPTAAVAASDLVQKDGAPRTVVQLHSHISATSARQVQIAEVPGA